MITLPVKAVATITSYDIGSTQYCPVEQWDHNFFLACSQNPHHKTDLIPAKWGTEQRYTTALKSFITD